MKTIIYKNISGDFLVRLQQRIDDNEEYTIPATDQVAWASDNDIRNDVTSGYAQIGNDSGYFEDPIKGLNYLLGILPQEVTPTAPKNEYDLRPYGLGHKHIDASQQVYDITLNENSKDGLNISYSECNTTPQFYDCIFQNHSEIRDGVAQVSENTITTFLGRLEEGSAKLSRPINIDYKIELQEEDQKIYLWGIFIDAENFGDDDIVRLQIVDIDGVGVELGLYDQSTFEALKSVQGGAVIMKEYDECWVRHLNKVIEINTPDGSPGEIYTGLVLRIKYYCKDETKTNIKIWSDYKITLKEV